MTREGYEEALTERAKIELIEQEILNLENWFDYLKEFGYPEDTGIWEA